MDPNAGAIAPVAHERDLITFRMTGTVRRVSCRDGRLRRETMGVLCCGSRHETPTSDGVVLD